MYLAGSSSQKIIPGLNLSKPLAGLDLMTRDEPSVDTHDAVLTRVRALVPGIRERAGAAEEARTISHEVVDAFFAASISRILIPRRFGGYGLGLDTWFEVAREIGKADASHAGVGQ
jgi:alkylation response protein AidB-like acyl-CoA dehydrogenase